MLTGEIAKQYKTNLMNKCNGDININIATFSKIKIIVKQRAKQLLIKHTFYKKRTVENYQAEPEGGGQMHHQVQHLSCKLEPGYIFGKIQDCSTTQQKF